jgi:hypothetical protein
VGLASALGFAALTFFASKSTFERQVRLDETIAALLVFIFLGGLISACLPAGGWARRFELGIALIGSVGLGICTRLAASVLLDASSDFRWMRFGQTLLIPEDIAKHILRDTLNAANYRFLGGAISIIFYSLLWLFLVFGLSRIFQSRRFRAK